MKLQYLLPNRFKKVGLALLVPSLVLAILFFYVELEDSIGSIEFFDAKVFAFVDDGSFFTSDEDVIFGISKNNILDEITGVLSIISLLLIAFSKQKDEDEFISRVRLDSLVWATYINYGVLVISIIFVYGINFFWVLVFNMFTILAFFIIRFYWLLFQSKKALKS